MRQPRSGPRAAVSTVYIFLTLLAALLAYAWSWGQVYAPPLIILGLPLIWILLSRHAKSLITKDTPLAPGASAGEVREGS